MHKCYKFRAYPTESQRLTLETWQHAQRALWNAANAQRLERFRRVGYDQYVSGRRYLGRFDQHKELTECRGEFEWLRAVPQMMQQDLLVRLDLAWKSFASKKGGLPKFKTKSRDLAPMGLTRGERNFKVSARGIRITKLGDVAIRCHRELTGAVVRIGLKQDVDQWFVTVVCNVADGNGLCPTSEASAVGLDFGVANCVSDSFGVAIPFRGSSARFHRSIERAQRVVSRRRAGRGQAQSNNYRKAAHKVALLYRKDRRRRADFLHNLSSHYAKSHGTVVIEDLKVGDMTRSARGTIEKPGKNIRQKAGLNREILNVGWGELRRQLTYKCEWHGSKLIVVDPRYTSQACNECGCVDIKSRATQMLFMCVECGFIDHADVNAAKNILDRGIGPAGATTVAACGGFDSSRPTKQEEIRVSDSRNTRQFGRLVDDGDTFQMVSNQVIIV